MPSVVRAIVTLPDVNAIPEDAAVNVWHFNGLTFDDCYEDIRDALSAFYQDISSLFSVQTNVDAVNIRLYNLSDAKPRVPHLDETIDMGTHGTDAYPHELAVCLSFQADRVSGTPQSRRRGRIYLGPLARVQTTATDPTIDSGTISAIATAASGLLTASDAATTWKWGVYSPTDNAIVNVTNGWVDNAFDVQRRRGRAPSSRTLWS